ncbi:MAG: hypothetical protein AAGK00_19640 [Pseudomonadota bacterium]
MALSDAFGKLKEGLLDLSSLEVRTFTGEIDLMVGAVDGDADNFKKMLDEAKAEGKVSMKIYTRLDADGDSDHFVAASGVDDAMVTSHVAAFKMGQEIRRSYIELFRDLAERTIT